MRGDDNSLPCQKWSFVGAKKSLSIRSRGVRKLRTDPAHPHYPSIDSNRCLRSSNSVSRTGSVRVSAVSHLQIIPHAPEACQLLLFFFILTPASTFEPDQAGRPREITKSLWHNGCSFRSSEPHNFFLHLAVWLDFIQPVFGTLWPGTLQGCSAPKSEGSTPSPLE
jgi:hypothetical protein